MQRLAAVAGGGMEGLASAVALREGARAVCGKGPCKKAHLGVDSPHKTVLDDKALESEIH